MQDNLEPNAPVRARRHSASVLADSMAKTLFGQDPPTYRYVTEMKLRRGASEMLRNLYIETTSGAISTQLAHDRLAKLDSWIAPKLSGQNVLSIAREVETRMPEWIIHMPNLIGRRYEEMRVARLWSALLNPGALNHLRTAIAQENALNDDGDLL